MKPGRRWTEAEDDWLRAEWGKTDIVQLGRRLERAPGALTERARKLRLRRPTLTLRAFARLHSVAISRVYWALEQRGMKPQYMRRATMRRIAPHCTHYALTPAQQEELRPLLHSRPKRLLRLDNKKSPRGMWGVGIKPDACLECGKNDKLHYARGYDKSCYMRVLKWTQRRQKNPNMKPRGDSAPRSLILPTR